MSGWPERPVVYEVDTWPWLRDLSEQAGAELTLADVPANAWDAVVAPGVDAVWLMGVWERSPAGLAIALRDARLVSAFHAALPDLRPDDVAGSPYCVRSYTVDERLGGDGALAHAREELRRRGARLVLDYVPNHVAPDHPWIREHPERFVRGSADDLERAPDAWFDLGGQILARGRDPYFPPWPDVVQLDAFATATRRTTADTLIRIGDACDGVRCDMAMLMTNEVFARTWGSRVGDPPAAEFWPEVVAAVRARHPDLVLIAEAYWDLEWELQRQGFDFCYDKRLYDRLVNEGAGAVRAHLGADPDYQRRLLRFTENHDEPRAATALPGARSLAAAVVVATAPGATLWHDGQFEGRRVQLPVFLGRRPDEPVDASARAFHRRLLAELAAHHVPDGEWSMRAVTGWPDNPSSDHLVAWAWSRPEVAHLIVVNLSDAAAQGRIPLPWPSLAPGTVPLKELVTGTLLERDGHELADPGLYVDLPPWGFHLVEVPLSPWEPPAS